MLKIHKRNTEEQEKYRLKNILYQCNYGDVIEVTYNDDKNKKFVLIYIDCFYDISDRNSVYINAYALLDLNTGKVFGRIAPLPMYLFDNNFLDLFDKSLLIKDIKVLNGVDISYF